MAATSPPARSLASQCMSILSLEQPLTFIASIAALVHHSCAATIIDPLTNQAFCSRCLWSCTRGLLAHIDRKYMVIGWIQRERPPDFEPGDPKDVHTNLSGRPRNSNSHSHIDTAAGSFDKSPGRVTGRIWHKGAHSYHQ